MFARARTPHFIISLLALVWTSIASSATPVVGAPKFGPLVRSAKPIILVADARNPRSYGKVDLISGVMTDVSNANYARQAEQTAAAVRGADPTLDVTELMRGAFKCGIEGSMCTELVALGELAPKQSLEEAAQALLEARGWNEARLLAVWWDRGDGFTTHASLREVTLTLQKEFTTGYPILVGYSIPVPKDARDPHAEAWGQDPSVPKQATIRESMVQLEPLAQFALSWAANNDKELYLAHIRDELSQVRRLRKQGLQCKGMRNCNEAGEGMVAGRLWTWRALEEPMGEPRKPSVWEVMSRPQLPTM